MTAASNDTEASPSDFTADLNTPHDDAPPHYYYALLDDNDHRSPPPHHHTMNNHRHQPTRSAPPHNGGSGLFSPLLVEGGGGDFSASLLTDTDDKNNHSHHIDNLLGNNPAAETLLLDCSERQLFLQDDDDDHDRRNHPRPDSSFHGEHTEDSYTSSPNNQNGTSRRPLYYSSRRRAPLNGLNYLNVVTFALHPMGNCQSIRNTRRSHRLDVVDLVPHLGPGRSVYCRTTPPLLPCSTHRPSRHIILLLLHVCGFHGLDTLLQLSILHFELCVCIGRLVVTGPIAGVSTSVTGGGVHLVRWSTTW